ncbi:MAG: hypothetical protein CMJ44_13700 [Pimelobacter sp.]|nr:hypothetical protein [Pimelobacter sp.]
MTRAGALTRLRVEKDIQLLGAVAAHLAERGRSITLDEVLSDTTLLSFDTSLQVSHKTRENKRGIARRLQAAHRGLPWRAEKRSPGVRAAQLVPHSEVSTLHRILRDADEAGSDSDAVAFRLAVDAARTARRDSATPSAVADGDWVRARRFAARHGWNLTHRLLKACVTHETLDLDQPVAVLVRDYGLSRRDLDLALTSVHAMPALPDSRRHDLLRGTA